MRILIVEDESTLNKTLSEGLRELGFQTDEAMSFKDANYYVGIRNYDLVLLDWMLPDGDGIDLIPIIKRKSQRTAAVIISARDDVESEIEALNKGADDYITKPFEFDALVSRIEARVRHNGTNIITVGELLIDPDEESVKFREKELGLNGKPFEVLAHLARHRDQIVSKEQLLDAIWEEPELVTPNVIEVAINQIRAKVDKYIKEDTIETVRRRGYRFCYPREQ
ncbi:MAG: homeostatic response regulator transcription factor HsrA [Helicobacteraceae bacterium]|jgi:two-component system OmpR family response regulator|nr:homeostatic response regulator transcription factor HsrA [Helicobacteraceae bacterium]